MGAKEALADLLTRLAYKLLFKRHLYVHLNNYPYPICLRAETSDYGTMLQVFREKQYSDCEIIDNPKLIVDCGANAGYASMYFLNLFPGAYVIAVEPDAENVRIAQTNLHPYGGRVQLIHSGIWSHETGLIVCRRYITEAEFFVRECQDNETPTIQATTVDALLATAPVPEIDILKVDIEGAEGVIFDEGYQNWLPKVKNILIEIHDKKCEEAFLRALAQYDYELSQNGEITFCKNLSLRK